MPHGDGLPVTELPDNFAMYSEDEDCVSSNSKEQQPSISFNRCRLAHTPPLIRSQKASSMTSSVISTFQKLRQNFWHQGYNSGIYYTTIFRNRNQEFEQFFKTVGYFTYCKDIDGMMNAMHMRHSPEQWRLFIDASKTSLKTVLLLNGNKLPFFPVAYAPSTK